MKGGKMSSDHLELPGAAQPDHPRVPTTIARGTGRRMQILAGTVAAVLLVGFFVTHTIRSHSADRLAAATATHAAAPPLVDVVTVQSAPQTDVLALPGEAAAWYESTIYARVDGYVGKWFVDIGDHVHEGQVLATIETPRTNALLVAAQARVRAAEAEVDVGKAQARFARSTYERWNNSPKGVVSEQEREEKKASYESAQARWNAAVAQVNLAQAEVDRLNAAEQFKEVRAPFTGIIVQRHIDIGNLVTAGSTSGNTPLYRMTKNDPIRIFIQVPQSAAASMKIGTPAHISVSNLQGRSFDGTITRTANAVDVNARTLRVEVDLPNPDGALVPGLFVQAAFAVHTQGVSQVPAAALVFRASGPQVAVVGGNGTVEFRNVSIARDNGGVVELASGVRPGEKVALNISSQIADGEKVRLSTDGDVAGAASSARSPAP
jgi:membrane fusion protein, multidrug efflux system